MRITIFQQAPDIGGAEWYMSALAKEWVKGGNQVVLFTNYWKLKELFTRNGATVHHLPYILDVMGNRRGFVKTLALLPAAALWYRRVIGGVKESTDVIVSCGYTEKLLVTAIAESMSIPVVWLEFPPMEPLLRRNLGIPKLLYSNLSRIPRRIIAISKNTKRSLINDTHLHTNKVTLVYPGSQVPGKKEKERANREAKKRKRKLKISDKKVIGIISRVAQEKQQEQIILSLPYVLREVPDCILLIAGRGPDLPRLQNLVTTLGLDDKVLFLGFVGDRNATLAMMDVFVFPATWELEGFGLAIVEAMLMQKPIVAANFGPTKEILKHNENGVFVKSKSPENLSHAIVSLLEDRERAKTLGKQAAKTAQSRFDIRKSAEKILKEFAYAVTE